MLGEWDWALTAMAEVSVEHLEAGDRATLLRTREEISPREESPSTSSSASTSDCSATEDSQQYSNLLAGTAGGRLRRRALSARPPMGGVDPPT